MDKKNIESQVIIIGAGAAGLAAYNMLKFNGINSIILEYYDKPGRKLLATGNGRCNLTNNDLNINYYYPEENRGFLKNIFDRFNNNHTINFFHEIGIETACVNNKHFYPANYRAEDVVFALTNRINENEIFYNTDIVDIIYENNCFNILTSSINFKSMYLIIATSLNASCFACEKLLVKDVAKSFNIKFNKPTPILVPLKTNDKDFLMLDGVRHTAKTSLFINDEKIVEDIGQIQFNKEYLSGITIFDLSLASANKIKNNNVKIIVDFLLPLKENDLKNYIYNRYNHFKEYSARNLFNGLLDKKIIMWIFEKYGIDINEKIKTYNPEVIFRIAQNLKNYEFSIIEYHSFKRAQSAYGGIDISELNNNSLSCKKNNSLYFIGECVDISGKCGGYNLQFAWSSSFIATDDISKKIKNIV